MMSEDGISQSIRLLTSPEEWEAGLALFNTGGVMNVHYSAKAVDARVVNDSFAFETVSIAFRSEKIIYRCTCNSLKNYCRHVIALLLYVAKETPELLNALPTLQENAAPPAAPPVSPVPQPPPSAPKKDAEGESEVSVASAASVSVEAIRDFLGSPVNQAKLLLHCSTEIPQLTLAKQRLVLQGSLLCHGTLYSQGNIRKIVENGAPAGNMHLADFDPQSQQVMRFLLQYAEIGAKELSLDSEACADLFHCLRGSNILSTPSGVVQFHLQPLQVQFSVEKQSDGTSFVTPGLLVPERGVLSGDGLTFVAGRGGYWVGNALEYWWFPGILPFSWLRIFIQGQAILLKENELARLTQLCDRQRFPGKVVMTRQAVLKGLQTGKVRPVLTLDWDEEGLLGELMFDYDGTRISVTGGQTVLVGKGFIRRDEEAEHHAMAVLEDAGFSREDDTWRRLRLQDKSAIWNFMQGSYAQISSAWLVYWTPQVRANILATTDATLTIRSGDEGQGWFETTCDVKAADGTAIPFALALEAVRNDDEFIRLPGGAVVRLPEDLFALIRTLVKRANQHHDNCFNLDKCHAVALVDAMDRFWDGPKPDWYTLKQRILHPEKLKKLRMPGKLGSVLRDYQKEGVQWLALLNECGFNGVLADEMGLGKTVQALSALALKKQRDPSDLPSIVVCPTSLLENWRAEAAKFTPKLSVLIVTGLDRVPLFKRIPQADLVITSYSLLRRDILEYDEIEFDYVILDEAQHIKNAKTANAQACKDLHSNHRLVLTGTPMENRPSEIWSLFDFLQPGYLGNQHDFRQTYELRHDPQKQQEAAQNLSAIIRPFVLRRTKAEVCAELPPKLEQDLYCEMGEEQRRLYDHLLLASRTFLEKIHSGGLKWSEKRMEMLAMITRLRQVCCHPDLLPEDMKEGMEGSLPSVKMELAKEVVLEAIDSGHRILLFSQFTSVLKFFQTWLKSENIPFECIDGSTRDRQKRVDRFNENTSIPLFLLSLKAGGVGLNLPGADTVIHYDQWWNPMVEDQATDRSHRIGQTRTVTSIRLVTRNTIEEKILKLQDSKRELFNQIIGDAPSSLQDITQDDIDFLLK